MLLTARAALVALAGVVLVLVEPLGGRMVWYVVCTVLLLAAVDVGLAGAVAPLRITRRGDATTRLGQPARTTLTVSNPGRRTVRGMLRDAWPPSAGAVSDRTALSVPAGERRTVTTTLVPTRRGNRTAAAVTVRSLGPLGLAGRQRSREVPGALQVLPPFHSRVHLPERLARLKEIEGQVAARGRGRGTEFDALRDYVVGDDVRSIDWRATARRDTVVVRTWRPERDRRIVVAIDTGRTSAGRVADATRLDSALDATLLLAALAGQAGDRVDFLAYDVTGRAAVDRANRDPSLGALVTAMAPLEPALVETDLLGMAAEILRRSRGRRSLVVLMTGLDTVSVESGLLPALGVLGKRHTVVVASVADPHVAEMAGRRGDAESVYAAAAAARVAAERRRAGALVRKRGGEVVDVPPDRFAPAVADAYLELKAAGRL